MTAASLICSQCGVEFSLPAAVQARYPGWRPSTCIDCRNERPRPAAAATDPKDPTAPRRRPALTAPSLTLAEVLARYTRGPDTGVFTDGSCQPNPGPGGWGAVYVRDGTIVAQDHGHEPQTTNNRMELLGIIAGLSMIGPGDAVDIYSDSALIVNTLTSWAKGWEARGWRRKEGPVMNLDLVQRAYALAKERPQARIRWIKAHDGTRWNEFADSLSTAYLRETL